MYSCAISAFFIFILILSRLRIVKILSSTSKLFRFFFSLLGSGLNRESKYLNIVYFLSRDFFFFFILNLTILVVGNRKKKNEYIYETAFYTFRIVFTRNIVETFCEKMKRIKSRFSVHRRHDLLHSEDVRASHDGSIKWTASPSILVATELSSASRVIFPFLIIEKRSSTSQRGKMRIDKVLNFPKIISWEDQRRI